MPQKLNAHWLSGLTALLLLGATVGTIGCSDDKSTGNGNDPRFAPAQVTIVVGDTVKWTAGEGDHTVTSGTGSGDPNAGDLFDFSLDEGSSVTRVFNTLGTFDYFCIPHEGDGMKGKVIVTALGIDTTQVSASGTSFSPANFTITVGDAVRWTASGSHTVTSGTGSAAANAGDLFDQALNNGQTFTYTFSTVGSFPYFCRPHEGAGMKGTVTVAPALKTVEVDATQ